MSDWTISRVCERAEREFAYYEEQVPGSGVKNAVMSILSDLSKFPEGEAVLRSLDTRAMLLIAAESDDTALQKLIGILRAIKVA